jgi:alkylated DNA repair dioxygenase AlkB
LCSKPVVGLVRFDQKLINILPYEGEAYYFGPVLNQVEATNLYQDLYNTTFWQHDVSIMFGKRIVTKRRFAWYGDQKYSYQYSKVNRVANIFTEPMLDLKHYIEVLTGAHYNSCLLNLYHSGDEGMAWHNDSERELEKHGSIASVSLGAERRFLFKHRSTAEKVELNLEPGSLLLMRGATQDYWLHSLPKTKKVKEPRINLTFRTIAVS